MANFVNQQTANVVTSVYAYQPYENRIKARAIKFAKAWDAYNGQLPDALKVKPNMPNDNVKINSCKTIIDKGTSFLFGREIHFSLDDDDADESPEEVWLDKAWSYNHKQNFLTKLAMTGGVCGQVFVQIVDQKPFPRLISIDPSLVDVVTKPDDVDSVLGYTIQYRIVDPSGKEFDFRKRILLIEPGTTSPFLDDENAIETDAEYENLFFEQDTGMTIKEHWQILEEQRREGDEDWTLVRRIPWMFSWPPIASCQNLQAPHVFWGLSDLEDDVIHLNKAMNFVLSNTNRIIRYHAHPRVWVKGTAPEQLKNAIDETLVLPSTDADIGMLQMVPGGIEPSNEHYRLLKDAIHEVARIPQISVTHVDDITSLSGIAMQIMYQPLVEKTDQKRITYGILLCELSRRMMVLGGKMDDNLVTDNPTDSDGDEDHDPTPIHITWPEVLPQDNLELRQALSIDANLGIVSAETISDRVGYDFQTEQDRRHNQKWQMPNIINDILPTMNDADSQGAQVTPGNGTAAKIRPGSGGEGQTATPPARGGSAFGKNDKQRRAGTRGANQAPASRR